MKKAITTLIHPRGWMSIIGRSVFLVLFAWCMALTTTHGQTCDLTIAGDEPIITGTPATGSGASASILDLSNTISRADFEVCFDVDGPTIADPCSCSGATSTGRGAGAANGIPSGRNIFDDQIIIMSPNNDDNWVYQSPIPGTNLPPYRNEDNLQREVAAGTPIPLVGTTVNPSNPSQTLYVYVLEVQHPADVGYTAVVEEISTDNRYEAAGLGELSVGARCFDITKDASSNFLVVNGVAGTEAGADLGVVDIDDVLNCVVNFPNNANGAAGFMNATAVVPGEVGIGAGPGSLTGGASAIGSDGQRAILADAGDLLVLDLGRVINAGDIVQIEVAANMGAIPPPNTGILFVDASSDGVAFDNEVQFAGGTEVLDDNSETTLTYVAAAQTRFIRFRRFDSNGNFRIDNVASVLASSIQNAVGVAGQSSIGTIGNVGGAGFGVNAIGSDNEVAILNDLNDQLVIDLGRIAQAGEIIQIEASGTGMLNGVGLVVSAGGKTETFFVTEAAANGDIPAAPVGAERIINFILTDDAQFVTFTKTGGNGVLRIDNVASIGQASFSDGGTYTLTVNGEVVDTDTYEYGDGATINNKLVSSLALCNNANGNTITLTYTPNAQPTIGSFDPGAYLASLNVDANNNRVADLIDNGTFQDLNDNDLIDLSEIPNAPNAAQAAAIGNAYTQAFLLSNEAAIEGAGGCPITCSVEFDVDYCPIGENGPDGVAGTADDTPGGPITIFDRGGVRGNGTLYPDNQTHRVTICPDDPDDASDNPNKKFIRFIFGPTDFNISAGDTVRVYDGAMGCDGTPPLLFQDSDGVNGGQNLNGGWVDASCDNTSGCLTFEFSPKNDDNKGSYQFTYEKRDRSAVVSDVADQFESGKCDLNQTGFIAGLHNIETLSSSDCDSYQPVLVPNALQTVIRRSNGDLLYTSSTVGNEDTNNNRILDAGEDTNGNGVLDINEDLNGNFILDAGEDLNGNGILDIAGLVGWAREVDADGDGVVDPIEDRNGNGVFDAGLVGVVGELVRVDPNGGGIGTSTSTTADDMDSGDLFLNSFLDENDNGLLDQGDILFLEVGNYTVELNYWEQDPLTDARVATIDYALEITGIAPVCNDEINVDLGASCEIWIHPDDVLEGTCVDDLLPFYDNNGNLLFFRFFDGQSASSLTYKVSIDKNGDGDFADDDEDNPKITSCGRFRYEVITFTDADMDGVIDASERTHGRCWGYINAEENSPINVDANLPTIAELTVIRDTVCASATRADAQADIAETDTVRASVAVDQAEINLADAQASLKTNPNSQVLQDAVTAAENALKSAQDNLTAEIAEATALRTVADSILARCNFYRDLVNRSGVFIGCSEAHLDSANIVNAILPTLTIDGVCNRDSVDTLITLVYNLEDCAIDNNVTVTFKVSKSCGSKTNEDEVTVTVPIRRPAVVLPADTLISCNVSISPDNLGYPVLDLNGNGVADDGEPEVRSSAYTCSYIAEFSDDDEFPGSCPQNKKLFRTWKVLDWCQNPPTIAESTQLIEFTDTIRPVVSCPDTLDLGGRDNPHVFNTDAGQCTTTISLAGPEVTDECDDAAKARMVSVHLVSNDSMIGANLSAVNPLACGQYYARYVGQDTCGNVSVDTCSIYFNIVDEEDPTAICQDQVHVSLGGADAVLTIDAINAGSNDNCASTMGIRIKDSDDDLAQSVTITCDSKDGLPQVELVITDKSGNSNKCWSQVVVEDKVPPTCTAPADVDVNCDDINLDEIKALGDDSDALSAYLDDKFGTATCTDNLSCIEIGITQSIDIDESDCGRVTITRTFVGSDWALESAPVTQTINVVYNPDWKLTFPADATVDCGESFPEPLEASDILTSVGFCDRLSVNVEGQVFRGESDACLKMVRTYTVWNTCGEPGTVYNVNAENGDNLMVTHDSTSAERIIYVQTIRADITEGPEITITLPDADILGAVAKDDTSCGEEKEFEVWAGDCLGNDIPEEGLQITLYNPDGEEVAINSTSFEDGNLFFKADVGPGEYTVSAWATDGCGNSSTETATIVFVDKKAPAIWTLNGIATEVMPVNKQIDIWANDFIISVTDCSPYETGIWHDKLGPAPEDCGEVKELGQSVVFECDQVGTQLVRIYAWDSACNFDYVETYIIIQDNNGACDDGPSNSSQVAGKVVSTTGDLVEAVNVAVNGTATQTRTTNASGTYAFDLNNGGDYTITPEKDIEHLNGVSTYDLVLISRHILQIEQFDSPYQFIAADANNNGGISTFDIVVLRQLILNITSEFPNNTSWRFVDASYDFGTDVTTTLSQNFPEVMNINNLSENKLDNDFVAVKVGDINASAVTSSLASAAPRNAVGTMVLTTEDRFVQAGESVEVTFTSADAAAIAGYQFTMNYAGLEFAELIEGVATANNFNTDLRGALVTSWNGEATANDDLFTVQFTATTSGNLSELISISSDVTAAEAYNTTGELLDVAIEFTADATQASFNLEQNTPNPFNGETNIGFTLPQSGSATLTVMDVQGRVLKAITGDYARGYNVISINAKDLNATGVLHYQLESANNVATKKMIILE